MQSDKGLGLQVAHKEQGDCPTQNPAIAPRPTTPTNNLRPPGLPEAGLDTAALAPRSARGLSSVAGGFVPYWYRWQQHLLKKNGWWWWWWGLSCEAPVASGDCATPRIGPYQRRSDTACIGPHVLIMKLASVCVARRCHWNTAACLPALPLTSCLCSYATHSRARRGQHGALAHRMSPFR